MLSQQDMSLLFSFYDWLGLPMEVIELLLSYCTASGHTGMRYIEKGRYRLGRGRREYCGKGSGIY